MNKMYDIVLLEKEGIKGITNDEITKMYDLLASDSAYPVDLQAFDHECSGMGLISVSAAEQLDFDYTELHRFIAGVLEWNNIENETEDGTYHFRDLNILLTRNLPKKYYFTFGNNEKFPYQDGYLIVIASDIKEAWKKFRAKYPDKSPGILNCSDYYTESVFNKHLVDGYFKDKQPFETIV